MPAEAAHLPCGVFVCTVEGNILAVNPTLCEWLGRAEYAIVGQPFTALLVNTTQAAPDTHDWQSALARTLAYARADGTPVRLVQTCLPLPQAPDAARFVITLVAAAGAARQADPWYSAHHDLDTGLPNRWLLLEHLETRWRRRSASHRLVGYAVHLRERGRLGRAGGIAAWADGMRLVAERLRRLAGADGVVARLGGAEFFLAVPEDSAPTPGQLLARLRAPLPMGEEEIRVSVALGVHLHAGPLVAGSDLVQRSSLAATAAGAAGGDCIEHYSPDLQARVQDIREMTRDLQRVLETGQLHLAYQPEVALADMRMTTVEALLRWNCPRRGPVSPAQFIPLAEEAGLVHSLGAWVLREACRFARRLATRYVDAPTVAVNISPLQLHEGDLAAQVQATLEATGLDPSRLELEITEGVLLEDRPEVFDTLQRLAALGVRLTLDDFGTGYSCLAYLTRLPIHALKVDRTFVRGLPQDRASLAVVNAVLGLARGLELRVTAEGIETPAQEQLLRELGCDLGQGFGIMKPLTPEGVQALLIPRV